MPEWASAPPYDRPDMTRPAGSRTPRLGRRMARFNQLVTNHATLRFAGRLPYFAIVTHAGRRSGRSFRTPVNVFPIAGGFRIALTYGRDSQWVRNVLAAGNAQIVTREKTYRVIDPQVVHDATREHVPGPMRLMLRAARVEDFLEVQRAD